MHLIADESDNHAVKVEEEHDEMEAELAERFLRDVSLACSVSEFRQTVYTFL